MRFPNGIFGLPAGAFVGVGGTGVEVRVGDGGTLVGVLVLVADGTGEGGNALVADGEREGVGDGIFVGVGLSRVNVGEAATVFVTFGASVEALCGVPVGNVGKVQELTKAATKITKDNTLTFFIVSTISKNSHGRGRLVSAPVRRNLT